MGWGYVGVLGGKWVWSQKGVEETYSLVDAYHGDTDWPGAR